MKENAKAFIQTGVKNLKGEQGAAFFFALLVMGFAMIFGSFLLSQTQQASHQAHKTNESLEARLMAEAGIDFYHKQLEGAIVEASGDAFTVDLPAEVTHELSDTHGFTIDHIASTLNGDKLTVTFTSTGTVGNGRVKIEQQTVLQP